MTGKSRVPNDPVAADPNTEEGKGGKSLMEDKFVSKDAAQRQKEIEETRRGTGR